MDPLCHLVVVMANPLAIVIGLWYCFVICCSDWLVLFFPISFPFSILTRNCSFRFWKVTDFLTIKIFEPDFLPPDGFGGSSAELVDFNRFLYFRSLNDESVKNNEIVKNVIATKYNSFKTG